MNRLRLDVIAAVGGLVYDPSAHALRVPMAAQDVRRDLGGVKPRPDLGGSGFHRRTLGGRPR